MHHTVRVLDAPLMLAAFIQSRARRR